MDTLDRIIKLKNKQKLTDKAFEDILKLREKTISSWKRGQSTSYLKMLPKIAEYFNVSTDYLLGITDNPALNKKETTEEEKIAAKIFTLTADQRRNVEKYIDFIQTQ